MYDEMLPNDWFAWIWARIWATGFNHEQVVKQKHHHVLQRSWGCGLSAVSVFSSLSLVLIKVDFCFCITRWIWPQIFLFIINNEPCTPTFIRVLLTWRGFLLHSNDFLFILGLYFWVYQLARNSLSCTQTLFRINPAVDSKKPSSRNIFQIDFFLFFSPFIMIFTCLPMSLFTCIDGQFHNLNFMCQSSREIYGLFCEDTTDRIYAFPRNI